MEHPGTGIMIGMPRGTCPGTMPILSVLFQLERRGKGWAGNRWYQPTNRGGENTGQGRMGLVTAGNGARDHTSGFPRSEQSQTTHKQGPKTGVTAMRAADANTNSTDRKRPVSPDLGRKGRVEGRVGRCRDQGNCTCNACIVTHTSIVPWTR